MLFRVTFIDVVRSASRRSLVQGALRIDSSQDWQELFEFGDLAADQVMVPRVRITGIALGTTADEIRELPDPRAHPLQEVAPDSRLIHTSRHGDGIQRPEPLSLWRQKFQTQLLETCDQRPVTRFLSRAAYRRTTSPRPR